MTGENDRQAIAVPRTEWTIRGRDWSKTRAGSDVLQGILGIDSIRRPKVMVIDVCGSVSGAETRLNRSVTYAIEGDELVLRDDDTSASLAPRPTALDTPPKQPSQVTLWRRVRGH